jgi:hypothetical protein
LDYWLRVNYADEPDTKQAVNEVVDQLVATGKFKIAVGLSCPDSGRRCKGLRMISRSYLKNKSRQLLENIAYTGDGANK